MSDSPTRPGRDWRPLVVRTSGSASEGVYGLILALAVIAVSRESDPSDAGRVAVTVLVVAVVFWLTSVYASVLGRAVSQDDRITRLEVARALRAHWSLVEVTLPLVLILGLGGIDIIPDRGALVAATVVALAELAAAGGYAAITRGAGPGATILSAMVAMALGTVVVLLKALVH